MKGLIEEIRKMGNVILVIDEVHNIVGAGDAEGSMNAANILKPALSRGEIQVIGATTFTEYRKHIEKDTALERRFQPVTVNEPNMEDTLKILKGIAHYYEQFHGVKIPEGILRQAVLLSERYITDRFLPDKAIDLIDEACSDLNLHDKNINRRMELHREIEDYDKERELLQGAEEPDFERLAELKSLTMKAQEELDALCAQGDPQLTMDNLARVIELWTKIPASRIREDEFHRLSELDKRLKEHIVGQDEAVEAVAAAIRRNRVGISPKHKPVSFIFVGPTGVGKTELVKQLAQDLFNSPDAPYYRPLGLDGEPKVFLKAKPKTDLDKCTRCGVCASLCPMGSINPDDVTEVAGICIKCHSCVRNCPTGAKYFDDPAFLSHRAMLERDYTRRAEDKIFTA